MTKMPSMMSIHLSHAISPFQGVWDRRVISETLLKLGRKMVYQLQSVVCIATIVFVRNLHRNALYLDQFTHEET